MGKPRLADAVLPATGRRRSKAIAFGRQLEKLRGTLSRADVCRKIARWGLTFHRSSLLMYERGDIVKPDPAILWALGRVYGLDTIDELLTVLVMDRTGRPLRVGVDIAPAGFDPQQREIAEVFASLAPDVKDAVMTIFAGLQLGEMPTVKPTRQRGRA